MKTCCRRYEKQLYLLADNLLESHDRKLLSRHLAGCPRCAEYLSVIRQSDRLFSEARATGKPFLSHDSVERLVRSTLVTTSDKQPHTQRPVASGRLLPRFAVAGAVMMVLLTIVATLLFVQRFETVRIASSPHSSLQQKKSLSQEQVSREKSFVWFNRGCAISIPRDSHTDIINRSQRTVRARLHEGEILVAGIAGEYDTIEIYSDPFVVRSLGTRFSVRRSEKSLEIEVLKGAVLISRTTDSTATIEAGHKAQIDLRTMSSEYHQINTAERRGLREAFAPVDSTINDTSENKSPTSGKTTAPTSKRERTQIKDLGSWEKHDNELNELMTHAEKFLQKDMWHAALDLLDRYLRKKGPHAGKAFYMRAICQSRIGRYEDAVESFQNAAAHTTDSIRQEAALHFANRILYRKLGDYEAARAGIDHYLSTYPNGKYEIFERHYLIEIFLATGRLDTSLSLIQRYVEKYPKECPSRRYRRILGTQNRDAVVESSHLQKQ